MVWMKEQHNFTPSKRAFQTQFRKWEFPSKQNPAHRNVDLVTRVRELWEQNYSQRDMVKTLNDEGFTIKERELMRVRAKNRWLLRIPNGQKPTQEEAELQAQLLAVAQDPDHSEDPIEPATPTVPDEILRKRKERHEKMQAESDERWASKKRRRRTREYAGIAADPPGPPRFPSETTLGESMQFLGLDGDLYKQVRADFQAICEDMSIIKKTLAGTDKWTSAKNKLVLENQHLAAIFLDAADRPAKELALDVIATDVTKRMRTVETRMTIVDAKNILGLNPEQSRQIRSTFYAMLEHDHFTSKLETGPEHWDELKSRWVEKEPVLHDLLPGAPEGPMLVRKRKALEIICRDVMKRLRDSQKKDDPDSKPSPAKPMAKATPRARTAASKSTARSALAVDGEFGFGDSVIDPSILETGDFAVSTQAPLPIYVRPHPQSEVGTSAKMFISTLMTRTYGELVNITSEKWQGCRVQQVIGVAKNEAGVEVPFQIEDDDELGAYLDHVQGNKIMFLVQVSKT